MCYSHGMKSKKENFKELRRFFINAFVNAEISLTEIENFFQNYLEYIFNLNNLNLDNFDIQISKVQFDERHPKREKKYKSWANQEIRSLIKRRILSKPCFKPNCADFYFDAMMQAHDTLPNKFNIWINKNSCHARNDEEIQDLIFLFNSFAHEVHHIIQYITRPKEMDRYDYLSSLHNVYIEHAEEIASNKREAKKLKRTINQHLQILFSNCKPEQFADKKAFDYLDILFNEILNSLPPVNTIEEHLFMTFIRTLQIRNMNLYASRFYDYEITELKYGDSTNRLTNFPVEADLLEIN